MTPASSGNEDSKDSISDVRRAAGSILMRTRSQSLDPVASSSQRIYTYNTGHCSWKIAYRYANSLNRITLACNKVVNAVSTARGRFRYGLLYGLATRGGQKVLSLTHLNER